MNDGKLSSSQSVCLFIGVAPTLVGADTMSEQVSCFSFWSFLASWLDYHGGGRSAVPGTTDKIPTKARPVSGLSPGQIYPPPPPPAINIVASLILMVHQPTGGVRQMSYKHTRSWVFRPLCGWRVPKENPRTTPKPYTVSPSANNYQICLELLVCRK